MVYIICFLFYCTLKCDVQCSEYDKNGSNVSLFVCYTWHEWISNTNKIQLRKVWFLILFIFLHYNCVNSHCLCQDNLAYYVSSLSSGNQVSSISATVLVYGSSIFKTLFVDYLKKCCIAKPKRTCHLGHSGFSLQHSAANTTSLAK